MPDDLKKVFISYRRANIYIARSVHENLTAHAYDVFLDYESLNNGPFAQLLLNQIVARPHFIVILTPSTLARCNEPGDWLRREIAYAIEQQRNIVPLMFEGFAFKDYTEYLTGKLSALPGYNGIEVPQNFFREAMSRLRDRFLNSHFRGEVRHTPAADQPKVNELIERINARPAPTQEQLNAEVSFERGYQSARNGDHRQAVGYYTHAIQLNPRYVEAYNNRGLARSELHEWQEAISDYTRAIELDPKSARIYSNLGSAHAHNDDLVGAVSAFTQAIELQPEDASLYYNRAQVYDRLRDSDRAFQDLLKAAQLDPTYPTRYSDRYTRAYRHQAQARIQAEDWAMAVAALTEALKLAPHDAQAQYHRGVAYGHLGDYARAVEDFDQVLRLDGAASRVKNRDDHYMAEVYKHYGDQQRRAGVLGRAISAYDRALVLNADYTKALNNRGIAHYTNGNPDQGIADWEQALAIDPDFEEARNNLRLARQKRDSQG